MMKARSSKVWGLRSIRSGSLGMVRLLLLALSLQIAMPVMDGFASAPYDPAGSFAADLTTSLCHDAAAPEQGAPADDTSHRIRHCLFCLPLVGGHATETGDLSLPVPRVRAAAAITAGDQPEPLSSHYILAYSRAPPVAAAPA